MACGARWGLRLSLTLLTRLQCPWLNGLWSPLGIETVRNISDIAVITGLNGLWSPLGIETVNLCLRIIPGIGAKWPVEPVGD